MRAAASHRAEMASQLLFGEAVCVLHQQGEWLQVKALYDEYEGWVTAHLMTAVDKEVATAAAPFVAAELLNEAAFEHKVFQVPMGSCLRGYQLQAPHLWDARFSYRGAVHNTSLLCSRQLFQNTIRPWYRAPYLWGGKTALGVDCSGFVQTVYKVLGVNLLRDAHQQQAQGVPLQGLNTVSAGDLAFFNNEEGRITHVGIVLGEGRIMHASGVVRIDMLTAAGILQEDGTQTQTLHSLTRVLAFAE